MSREENVNLAKLENKNTRKMSQEEIAYLVKRIKTPSGSISSMNQNTRKMSRKKNFYLAKLAMEADKYEDIIDLMEKILKMCVDDYEELTGKERDLLSEAYAHVINSSLISLRRICDFAQKEGRLGNVSIIEKYKGMIESDLTKKCCCILNLLQSQASSTLAQVFYWRKKGDYFECLAEFKTGAEREEALHSSLFAFKSAEDILDANWPVPRSKFPPRIPTKSDFTFSEAMKMISTRNLFEEDFGFEPFDLATLGEESHKDNTLGEESYKDNTLIMQQ